MSGTRGIICLFMWMFASMEILFAQGAGEPEAPRKDECLVIYTPHEENVAVSSLKEFQEESGIKVDVVFAGTGELIDRIRSEQQGGKPTCDVLWGGGAESIAANKDLFVPYVSSIDDLISPHDKDPAGLWLGESPVPVIILTNTALVSPEERPKGWHDLVDPKWKGKIAFADPAKSGSAYTLLCTMLLAGGGWDFLGKFAANLDGKLMDTSVSAYQLVADGQYWIGLSQEKSVQSLIDAGKKVAISYPEEGTSAVDDAIAITKGARNRVEAERFIEFVLDVPNQEMMATLFHRRPVRLDLEPPEGLPEMSSIPLVDYDLSWASKQKQEILERSMSLS